jgi:hypothetical protein
MAGTPTQVAEWMVEQFEKGGRLIQTSAAYRIKAEFGPEHVLRNKNGNWGIHKAVLEEFRKLTPDGVVWSRSQQLWRRRRPQDPPDKRMVR